MRWEGHCYDRQVIESAIERAKDSITLNNMQSKYVLFVQMNIVDKCERCERKSFRPIEFGVSVSRASKNREVYEYILEIIVNTEYNTFQVKREINPFACADT